MQFVSGMFSEVKHKSLALFSGGRYRGEEEPYGHCTHSQIPIAYFGCKFHNCICLISKMMHVDKMLLTESLVHWFFCHIARMTKDTPRLS